MARLILGKKNIFGNGPTTDKTLENQITELKRQIEEIKNAILSATTFDGLKAVLGNNGIGSGGDTEEEFVEDTTALFMAPTGSDSNSGTKDSPLASINGAVAKGLGTKTNTLYIRSGEYVPTTQQKIDLKGTETNRIMVQKYPQDTEAAKFNLTNFPFANVSNQCIIFVRTGKYITFKGLEFFGSPTTDYANGIVCISTTEDCFSNIIVDGCYFHEMGGTKVGKMVSYEAIERIPTSGCKVLNCKFENIANGTAETVRETGLVDGMEVAYCEFIASSNIGLLCAGNYGSNKGQCTNSHFHDNYFSGCGEGNSVNPASIYIDGGKNALVENNTITNCNTGFSICAEKLTGEDVTGNVFRNNTISNWSCHAIHIGHYTTGVEVKVEGNIIQDNTLVQGEGSSNTAITIYRTTGVEIEGNTFDLPLGYLLQMKRDTNAIVNSHIKFNNNKITRSGASTSTKLVTHLTETSSGGTTTTEITFANFLELVDEGTGNTIVSA